MWTVSPSQQTPLDTYNTWRSGGYQLATATTTATHHISTTICGYSWADTSSYHHQLLLGCPQKVVKQVGGVCRACSNASVDIKTLSPAPLALVYSFLWCCYFTFEQQPLSQAAAHSFLLLRCCSCSIEHTACEDSHSIPIDGDKQHEESKQHDYFSPRRRFNDAGPAIRFLPRVSWQLPRLPHLRLQSLSFHSCNCC